MHRAGACPVRPADDRLPAGTLVTGEVVCHHPFGLGIRLHDRDEHGHVDVPHVSSDPVRGPEDYPPIGKVVRARVVGYSGANAQRVSEKVILLVEEAVGCGASPSPSPSRSVP